MALLFPGSRAALLRFFSFFFEGWGEGLKGQGEKKDTDAEAEEEEGGAGREREQHIRKTVLK